MQTEKLINDIIEKCDNTRRSGERISFINYKLYVNTIKKAFACINDSEKEAKYFQKETDNAVELTIIIPKNSSTMVNSGSTANKVLAN